MVRYLGKLLFHISLPFEFILALLALFYHPPYASAIDQTFTFLSYQTGSQDLSSSGGPAGNRSNYFSSLENKHGIVSRGFKVNPSFFSFDFYRVSGSIASGFGIETTRYNHNFSFLDGSSVKLSVYGFLYGFNFYYRGDYWFPFFGFGTGNFNAKVTEKLYSTKVVTRSVVFGQVDTPSYYKIGFRIPINSWGILATQQYTSADMNVATENKDISLGGSATLFGVYIGF